MSAHENNPFKPDDRMLRQFSALWIVFFGALAARQYHHQHQTAALILAVLAVTLGPLGIVLPRAMKPIFIGWMYLAYPIGWVVSRVVLGLIFYGLFTPVACFFRLTGRDALRLKPQPQAASCWVPKAKADRSQYFRQS
jgi:hypothetical protein